MGMFFVSLYYISRDDWCNVRFRIHIGVRLSRCSFRQTGQCEGLQSWSEQQVQSFTFFCTICNFNNCIMNRLRLFIILYLLGGVFICAKAYDFCFENSDGIPIYYNDVSINEFLPEVEVAYTSSRYTGELTIPEKVGNYTVIGIGERAFDHHDGLVTINLPNTLQYIGSYAFRDCFSLENVNMNEKLTEIRYQSFYRCIGLKNVHITASIVGNNAFDYCTNLKEVVFSNNVNDVGSWAFNDSKNIKTIVFEEGKGEVYLGYGGTSSETKYGLFYGLDLDSVYIGRGINYSAASKYHNPFYNAGIEQPELGPYCTIIPPYWFAGASKQEIVISEYVSHVAPYAFYESKIGRIVFPPALIKIGEYAFANSTVQEIIQTESNLQEIGKSAFSSCVNLKGLILADGLTEVSPWAFHNCSNLETLVLPESVTSIGSAAFLYCKKLKNINIPAGLTTLAVNAFSSTAIESFNCPSGITSLEGALFSDCSQLKEVVLHPNIESIGNSVFENCISLENIVLPDGITEISDEVFRGCSSLKEVNIPIGVTRIGKYAFAGCSSLQNIELPEYMYEIEERAFESSGLVKFVFPDSLRWLSSATHINCSNLKEVKLPKRRTDLSLSLTKTFMGCSSLESITIPPSFSKIETAFDSCVNLKRIYIEEGGGRELSIDYGLYVCALDSIHIGRNIYYYDYSKRPMIENQSAIKYCFIGGNINTNGAPLFSDCNVGKVVISNSVDTIQAAAFYNTIPDTLICQNINPVGMAVDALVNSLVYVPSGSGTLYRENVAWTKNLIVDQQDTISFVKVKYPGTIIASMKQSGMMNPENICKLKIEGAIDLSDWDVLRNDFPYLYYLDLSSTVIDSIPSNQFKDNCKLNDIILPNTIGCIGDYAFTGCRNLRSKDLFLPACTFVGENAFAGSYVEGVSFGKSVALGTGALKESRVKNVIFQQNANIGKGALQNCKDLESVAFNGTECSINELAFCGCEKLTSLVLPMNVEAIGMNAFRNCIGLSNLQLPQLGTKIGSYAFYGCSSLDNLELQGKECVVDSYAFAKTGIKSLTVKESVTSIGKYAFADCLNLEGKITLPNTVNQISEGLFKNCSLIDSVTLSDSVLCIDANAFGGCTNLKTINLPPSLHTIEQGAFDGCVNLEEIDIPWGLVNFDGAFLNSNIKRLRTHWQVPLPISETTFQGVDEDQCLLVVPANSAVNYMTSDGWKIFWNIKEVENEFVEKLSFTDSSVEEVCLSHWDVNLDGMIGLDELLRVNNLGSVFTANKEIRDFEELCYFSQLEIINEKAFSECTNLTTISIPASVTIIEARAFEYCTLSSVEIPKTVTSIGNYAFAHNAQLSNMKVHWNVPIKIGSNVFYSTNISTATLYVPKGSRASYENAAVWKNFGRIIEIGEETDYELGDPNNDGYIDVADLAAQVQFILGTAGSNLLLAAADMDASGVVEVNDYVALVNVILKQSNVSTRSAADASELDQLLQLAPVVMNEDGQGELWITLTAEQRQMSGFQLDLTLPEGVTIADEGITIESCKHNAWCEPMGANGYRIVCASLSNAAFASDTVMCVKLQAAGMKQGSYELTATGIVLSDTEAKRYESQAIRERVEVEDQGDGLQLSVNGDVLTLAARGDQQVLIALPNGMMVDSFELDDGAAATRVLPRGVYIVNGKKVVL